MKLRKLDIKNKFITNIRQNQATPEYKRAKRLLWLNQELKNLIYFAKWLIYNLLWLLPAYVAWGQQQLLTVQALDNQITPKSLFMMQQNINLMNNITTVLLGVGLYAIIRHGMFKRPFNKKTLATKIKELRKK